MASPRKSLLRSMVSRSPFIAKKEFAPEVLGEDKTPQGVPVLRGYLFKESRHGRMQRRFYATNNQYLNYFKRRKGLARKHVLASIDLRRTSTICVLVRNGKPSRRIAIQVQTGTNLEECIFLRAKTRKLAKEWVDGLNLRRKFWIAPEMDALGADGASVNDEFLALIDDWEERTDGAWFEDRGDSDEEDTDEGFVSCGDDDDEQKRTSPRLQRDSNSEGGDTEDSDEESEDGSPRPLSRTNSVILRQQAVLPSGCKFASVPPVWSTRFWSQPSTRQLRVRGPTYLLDQKKIAPTGALMELVALDVMATDGRVDHIASHSTNRLRQTINRGEKLPFIWVCNFQVPGPPFFHFCCYFAAATKSINSLFDPQARGTATDRNGEPFSSGFKKLMLDFFRGDSDDFRDQHFKLIPRVEEGPWVVRMGVPSKPALIGTKLKNRYFRGENYLEMDIDLAASVVALKLAQMAIGFCRLVTVDMAFLVEGKQEDQLPEQVLGIVRAQQPDFQPSMMEKFP